MIELKSTSNKINLEFSYLGLMDYQKSVEIQAQIHAQVLHNKKQVVLGLEHPAVITLGHRALSKDEVILSPIPQVKSTRGGLATLHSEGQLVIYPILNIREIGLGVRDYVLLLLESTAELLKNYEVKASVDEKVIGLYTSQGKIAFCGIQVKNGVTQHGVSININNDLSLFSGIRSCGVSSPQLDKLQNYTTQEIVLENLYQKWCKIFQIKLIARAVS